MCVQNASAGAPAAAGGGNDPIPRTLSCGALHPPAAAGARETLEREWTVWADSARSRVLSSEDFDPEGSSRRDISTWRDFWGFWSDVQEGRIELGEGSNLCIFERGVKPTWEDSQVKICDDISVSYAYDISYTYMYI
jgi:hypothetical protein